MLYKLKTPNAQYNGVTEGVPFSKGIGQTDNKNKRNVLVNDYGYEDVTDYAKDAGEGTAETAEEVSKAFEILASASDKTGDALDLENLTVPQLKEKAKELNLTNYSDLSKEKLIEKIKNA